MAQKFINHPANQAQEQRKSFVKASRSSNLGNPQLSLFDNIDDSDSTEQFYEVPNGESRRLVWLAQRERTQHFYMALAMVDGDEMHDERIWLDADNEESALNMAWREFGLKKIYPEHIMIYNMD